MFSSLVHLTPSLRISYPYLIKFHEFVNKYPPPPPPQFFMGFLLAQAKNGDEQFWNIEIFMQPMGRLSMYSKCLDFIFF